MSDLPQRILMASLFGLFAVYSLFESDTWLFAICAVACLMCFIVKLDNK